MTTEQINRALYRPLKSGSRYDAYFRPSNCDLQELAKGDTKVAIDQMVAWTEKYASDCKDIAPLLVGDTDEDTINNIQGFLYNHIQYKIDGDNQNLKSPACAWATKQDGTDCKSYSIFAGCILANLGFKFYYRRIQTEAETDAYTHVYVVIPIDQDAARLPKNAVFGKDYVIIDGTIANNIELPYYKADDVLMEPSLNINGLAAPLYSEYGATAYSPYGAQRAQMGCNCSNPQGLNLAGTGMASPITDQAYEGFQDFLDFLYEIGVSDYVVDEIEERTDEYLIKGIDPTFSVTPDGVTVGDYYIGFGLQYALGANPPVTTVNSGMTSSGINISTATPSIVAPTPRTSLGTSFNTGAVLQQAFNIASSAGWFNSTFGAVFANGFNLSCWGSSNSPEKSKGEVAQDSAYFLAQSGIKNTISEATVNKFLWFVDAYIYARNIGRNNGDVAKCTRQGNQVGWELMKKFRSEIMSKIEAELAAHNISFTTRVDVEPVHIKTIPSGYLDGYLRYTQVPVTKYTFKEIITPSPGTVPTTVPTIPNNNSNGTNINYNGTPDTKEASIGWLSMLLMGGAAVGLYLNLKKK